MSKFTLALAVMFAAALPLAAQQGRGTILGTVTDPSGAAIAGAAVAIENTQTNVVPNVQTNGEGFFPRRRSSSVAIR